MKFALSIAFVVALGSVGAQGQSRPDFSGTWAMDLTRSEAAAQGAAIGPVTVTIRQAPEELRIDTTRNGKTESVRYLPASEVLSLRLTDLQPSRPPGRLLQGLTRRDRNNECRTQRRTLGQAPAPLPEKPPETTPARDRAQA